MAADQAVKKSKLTIHHIVSRWFALCSGIFGTLGATCIVKVVTTASDSGTKATVREAGELTGILLGVFVILTGVFWVYKKKLHAAAKDEASGGILDLTPSEIVALTVDEALANLTSAMASIIAGLWFGLLPATNIGLVTLAMLGGGSAVLLIGEWLQLRFEKGTVGNYLLKSLNGMNNGSISWWVGFSMSKFTVISLGVPVDATGAPVAAVIQVWMWIVALVISGANVEVVDYLASRFALKSGDSPYGTFLFSMLKGIPVYSSGLILNTLLITRCSGFYLTATITWVCVSSSVVITIDQLLHNAESTVRPSHYYADEKMVFAFVTELVALTQQTFSFIGGGLAISAMLTYLPVETPVRTWVTFAVIFQVVSFLLQTARLRLIKKATVDDGATYIKASAREHDYIKLAA